MLGNFSKFQDVSVGGNDVCSDAGNYWPGRVIENCGAPWYICGLHLSGSDQDRLEQIQRLLPYPMVRILDGLGVPLVDEHARMCIPKGGSSE